MAGIMNNLMYENNFLILNLSIIKVITFTQATNTRFPYHQDSTLL